MKKDNNIYPCKVTSDYTPGQLLISNFSLHATLGHAEDEEAAARILYFSQQLNDWTGVSAEQMIQMMLAEVKLRTKKSPWYSFFTFSKKVPKNEHSNTLVSSLGAYSIFKGIDALINNGYLRQEKIDGEDIFFPTNKLAAAVKKFAVA